MLINLTNQEFQSQMEKDDVVLIDVRTPEEYGEGKIPGSKNINVMDATFMDEISSLDKEGDYLLYCRSGGRSGQAVQMMNSLGFNKVANLAGGILGWDGQVES